jgi:alkaline ceramidase TOD1/glycosyltransferase MUCI70-like protein
LSAIFANYDTPKPPRQQDGAEVEWLMVTDDPALDAPGWEVVYEPARPGMHPNRQAKYPKMTPWCYTDAAASVWVDASFQVTSPTFVADVLACARPLAQFEHPWRSCCLDEAVASAPIPKYAGEPIVDQAAYYRARGMPEGWGLFATGVIARRHDDPRVIALGEQWLAECHRWSFQDQVSEPFVLRNVGLRPTALPGTHLANPWLSYQGSARH